MDTVCCKQFNEHLAALENELINLVQDPQNQRQVIYLRDKYDTVYASYVDYIKGFIATPADEEKQSPEAESQLSELLSKKFNFKCIYEQYLQSCVAHSSKNAPSQRTSRSSGTCLSATSSKRLQLKMQVLDARKAAREAQLEEEKSRSVLKQREARSQLAAIECERATLLLETSSRASSMACPLMNLTEMEVNSNSSRTPVGLKHFAAAVPRAPSRLMSPQPPNPDITTPEIGQFGPHPVEESGIPCNSNMFSHPVANDMHPVASSYHCDQPLGLVSPLNVEQRNVMCLPQVQMPHVPTNVEQPPAIPLYPPNVEHRKSYHPYATAPVQQPQMSGPDLSSMIHAMREGFTLPKVELMSFDGNPLHYHAFMRSFDNNIHRHDHPPETKLAHLIQMCTSVAKEAIMNLIVVEPASRGYKMARETLRQRFGDRNIVIEAHIRKLITGPKASKFDGPGLSKLATEMKNCEIVLQAWGALSCMDSFEYLKQVFSRLPDIYKRNT